MRPSNEAHAEKRMKPGDILAALKTTKSTESRDYKCTCEVNFAALRPVSQVACNLGLWTTGDMSDAEHLLAHRTRYLQMEQKDRGRVIFTELRLSHRHKYDDMGHRLNKPGDGWFDYTINGKSVCQPVWLSAFPISKTTLADWQNIIRNNVDESGTAVLMMTLSHARMYNYLVVQESAISNLPTNQIMKAM